MFAVRGGGGDESPQFAGGLFAASERVVGQLFLVGLGVVGDAAVQAEAGVGEVGKFQRRTGVQPLVLVAYGGQGRGADGDAPLQGFVVVAADGHFDVGFAGFVAAEGVAQGGGLVGGEGAFGDGFAREVEAVGLQFDVEVLGFVGGVVQAQGEDAAVVLAEVARALQFGDYRGFDDGGLFGTAGFVRVPGGGHDAQAAVVVRDWHGVLEIAVGVEFERAAPVGDEGEVEVWQGGKCGLIHRVFVAVGTAAQCGEAGVGLADDVAEGIVQFQVQDFFAVEGLKRVAEAGRGQLVEAVVHHGDVDPGVVARFGDVDVHGERLFGLGVFRQFDLGREAAVREVGTKPAQADGTAVVVVVFVVPGVGEQPDALFPAFLPRDLQLCLAVFEGDVVAFADGVAAGDFDAGGAVKGRLQVEGDGVAVVVGFAVGGKGDGGRVVVAGVAVPAAGDFEAGGARRVFALGFEDVDAVVQRQFEGRRGFAVGGDGAGFDGVAGVVVVVAPFAVVVVPVPVALYLVEGPVEVVALLFAFVVDDGDLRGVVAAFEGDVGCAARQQGGVFGADGAAIRCGEGAGDL